MKDFGQQGYFLNFPSKFISENGRKAWLCYSANYFSSYRNEIIEVDPPGSHYGLVLQEIEFLSKEMYEKPTSPKPGASQKKPTSGEQNCHEQKLR